MEKIRIGIFGAGRGVDIAENLMLLDCEVVALCDFNEKSADNQLMRLLSEGKLTQEEKLLLDGKVLDKILNLPF